MLKQLICRLKTGHKKKRKNGFEVKQVDIDTFKVYQCFICNNCEANVKEFQYVQHTPDYRRKDYD
jgi:hypothetical protein